MRLAPELEERTRASRSTPAAACRAGRRIQASVQAAAGRKQEALQLLRRADGHGFPPFDSPLMLLAADTLFELQEHKLTVQAYREVPKG